MKPFFRCRFLSLHSRANLQFSILTLASKRSSGVFHIFFPSISMLHFVHAKHVLFLCAQKKTAEFLAKKKKNVEFSPFSGQRSSILTTVDPIKKIAPFFPIFICPFLLLCSDPLTTNISVRLGVCLNSPKRGKNCSRAKFCPALPNTTVSCNLVWPKTFPISSWSVCTSLAASELKYRSIVLFLPSQLLLGLGRSLLCTDPTMDIISMCILYSVTLPFELICKIHSHQIISNNEALA